MMRRTVAAVFVACLLFTSGRATAQTASFQRWLVASDVHFDPFGDMRLAQRLAGAPVERWRTLFAAAGTPPFSGYGTDTNYPLLESALEAMKNEVSDPPVVILSGDFLAHDFRSRFQAATKDQREQDYDAFVDKTIAFLASEFHEAFPRSEILPAIGNNDGYCGDYQSTPQSSFLAHMATVWSGGIVGTGDPTAFIAQFSTGGYYTAKLPAGNASAIVVNDVFWSSHYANACGDVNADPGGIEMNWLTTTLANAKAPVWVIAHVPPGVDVYATLHVKTPGPPIMMLADRFNDAFISLLGSPASHVAFAVAAHIHMNDYRLIGGSVSDPVTAMLLAPSISPVYFNNPSFTELDVDATTANVVDQQVFVIEDLAELAKNGKLTAHWKREYDFDRSFDAAGVNAETLAVLQQSMFQDGRPRHLFDAYYDGGSGLAPITPQTWRPYWCGNVALKTVDYSACAMPQIQTQLPPQPTAPPTATPAPTPTPTPAPSHSPSASPSPSPSVPSPSPSASHIP
jgi:sphingomyelin phosphodiesterase acid-like 3